MLRSIVRLLGRTLTAVGGILLIAAFLILLLALEGPGAPDAIVFWIIVLAVAGTPPLALGRLLQWLLPDNCPNEKKTPKRNGALNVILSFALSFSWVFYSLPPGTVDVS